MNDQCLPGGALLLLLLPLAAVHCVDSGTFGEMPPNSLRRAFKAAETAIGTRLPTQGFLDLGSGRGQAVIAACTGRVRTTRRFKQCRGIELSTELHTMALALKDRWSNHTDVSHISFVQGDFLKRADAWRGASVLICVSTAFDENLREAMAAVAAKLLEPGSIFITVTHPLKGPRFDIVNAVQLPMSWSDPNEKGSWVFIHQLGEMQHADDGL